MKKKSFIFLWLFFIIIVVSFGINFYMIKSTSSQIVDLKKIINIQDIDAILVLGCKVEDGKPSIMLANRLEKGIEVYNKLNTKIILSGDHGKEEYDEVNAMRDYILTSNIPTSDIFLDHAGFSTYDSIYRAKNIFDAKKIVIVTQKYHLYRALYLANQLGLDAVGVEADDIPQKSIMLKNELREVLSRDKNFFLGLFKPTSKYLGEKISLNKDGNVTEG